MGKKNIGKEKGYKKVSTEPLGVGGGGEPSQEGGLDPELWGCQASQNCQQHKVTRSRGARRLDNLALPCIPPHEPG